MRTRRSAGSGTRFNEACEGCRTGNYTIFYRILDDEVEIVRILHQREDVEEAFGLK